MRMTRNHQPDQAEFRVIRPEDIDWKPSPAFPPKALLAVLVGQLISFSSFGTSFDMPAMRSMSDRCLSIEPYT